MTKYNNKFIASLICVFSAFMLFTTNIGNAAEVPDVTNPAVVEAFVDGVVKPNMKKHNSPSGVVTVMKNGEIIFAKGYGYIDVDKRIPVDPKTSLFRPGSISKLFTWVSVMQLVEQDKLDLDVDVNTYLKTFNIEDTWPGQPVTLRHILTHTPGFEDGGLGYLIIDDPSRIIPLAQSLAAHQPVRINAPGEHVAYSNWGTALAGLIVANVSGIDFNTYVQKHIFDVLGMTSSSFVEPLPATLEANMAKAYDYSPAKGYTEKNYEIISNFGPAGALAASAYDMTLFAKALMNDGAYNGNRILKTDTLQQMLDEGFRHDDRVRGMGLGFIERRFGPDGFDNFGHDGGTTVFLSHFGMSLKEDFMLFSSFSGPGGGPTHSAFVKSFYDEFFPKEIVEITPPADFAERGQRYVGTYNSWRGNFTKIESLMRALGGTKVAALPDNTLLVGTKKYVEVDTNLFREVDGYGRIAFQEDDNGQVESFVIDGMGVMQLYKAPFYETSGFTFFLLGFSLLVFVGVFLRLAYQWSHYTALEGQAKNAANASIALASFTIIFFILQAIVASGGITPLMYELPTLLKVSFIFPILATVTALYHVYCSVVMWRSGQGASIFTRIRYSIVSLCGILFVWFYSYWNLLGFNYFG